MLSRMRRRSAAEEEERRGSEGDEHAWRFSCDQDSRILIEVAAHFASIYTLLVELYAVTFDVRPLAVWVIVLSCLADAILSVDFIASFFTSYWWLSGEGVWKQEFDLSRIARRNLTGSFVVDVWSIFPAQLLLKVVDPLGIMEDPGITIIRVFEVFKCLRSLRAFKQINTFQHATVIQSKLVESLSAVLLFLLLCHTLACVWFWFAKEEANGSSTSFFNRDTCSNRQVLLSSTQSIQYSCALLWAVQTMTTVGNDVAPLSTSERLFYMLAMVLGVISLLFIFLRLGIYYVESTGRNSKFKKEADAMIDYLARRNIPDDLREEVEDYFRFRKVSPLLSSPILLALALAPALLTFHRIILLPSVISSILYPHVSCSSIRWKESQGFNDLERIRSLPASIRVHTFHSITCGIASLVDFLSIKKLGDTSFWEVMTEELVEEVFAPYTWLQKEGDIPARILIVARGQVIVYHESSGFVYEVVRRGNWIGGTPDFSSSPTVATAFTRDFAVGFILSRKSIQRISQMFPDVARVIRDSIAWRKQKHDGARWKIMWAKHKSQILEIAASMSRPPAPWPMPRVQRIKAWPELRS